MDRHVTWQSSVKGKPKACYEGFVYNKKETSKSDPTVDFYVSERKRNKKTIVPGYSISVEIQY
jgi:hypothetical protein